MKDTISPITKRKFPVKPESCISTHGGAGYIAGDYRDENGDIICIACGSKCIDNKIAARRVVDHIEYESKPNTISPFIYAIAAVLSMIIVWRLISLGVGLI